MSKALEKTKVNCSLNIKFLGEDDHIYTFDDTWNIDVGDFQIQNTLGNKLKVSFQFTAQLESLDEEGGRMFEIPHEELAELQPYLEKLEILLDILSFQTDLPLKIEDGSFEFNGGGYASTSNPVINTISLQDLPGLTKRYQNLLKKEELINTFRFFRLSQIDNEPNGKAIKLWATLEALYKGYEKNIKSIWSTLIPSDQKVLLETIESLETGPDEKAHLKAALESRKTLSKTEMLSQKIKLMSPDGEHTQEQIKGLVSWWASSRHNPAHGTRIKQSDEVKLDALNDLESTLEMLLGDTVRPSTLHFFIGHPNDLGEKFWSKDDYTVKQLSSECWVKPGNLILGTHDQILESIGNQKISNNKPFLYVSHDQIILLDKNGLSRITDLSTLPQEFKEAVEKIQIRLNKEPVDGEVPSSDTE